MTQHSQGLVESVKAEANLSSPEEAKDVIRHVTGAMADHFPPEAWKIVASVVSPDTRGSGGSGRPSPQATAEGLFEDVAARADLDPAEAARYVRVVAEAVRGQLTDADVARLDDLLADELLALFEVDHRGELTEDQGATRGAKIVEHGGSEAP